MLVIILIQLLESFLTGFFSFLPKVSTLPIIFGVDVDSLLVSGVSGFNSLASSIWPLKDLMIAALAWVGYLFIKMIILKIFLGSRAPH